MKPTIIHAGSFGTIVVGRNILNYIGSYLKEYQLMNGRAVIITDDTVCPLYANVVKRSIQKEFGGTVKSFYFPSGEQSKNMEQYINLMDCLALDKHTRNDTIIALGGGVVGDLAGFVAATYLRGVTLVHVPTTLMAQVDSSIGGKTGVNLTYGKNLVGSFYNPGLVVTDINTLKTLPARDFRSGRAEIIKYGMLDGSTFFDRVRRGISLKSPDLHDIIVRCINYKKNIVMNDEYETDNMRIHLNLGHTIGHAIEQVTEYKKYTHGEAVAFGLIGISYLSYKRGRLSKGRFLDVINACAMNGFSDNLDSSIDTAHIIDAIGRDKKSTGDKVQWVIPRDIGHTKVYEQNNDVEVAEIIHVLQNLDSIDL